MTLSKLERMGSVTLGTRARWATVMLSLFLFTVVAVAQGGRIASFEEVWGPRFGPAHASGVAPAALPAKVDSVHRWNQAALAAVALDHTPVAPGESRVFGEQLGPGRTSLALAVVHIAVADAVNAITGRYRTYSHLPPAPPSASLSAAVAAAAHDTLESLYPSQAATFDAQLATDLGAIPGGTAKAHGINVGQHAAAAILASRSGDGSAYVEPRVGIDFFTSLLPGWWRKDPVGQNPLALGASWGSVTPLVLKSPTQFAPPPPPALNSPEYTTAFKEVKRLGGDGMTTPTLRTASQTIAGLFWGYDGTPGLGTPPRMYNEIAVQIADARSGDMVDLARLLALVNVALADAGIACWDTKYTYQFWRPVTGIREADAGTGPTGLGDHNPATIGDSTFIPLGAPASNLTGPNFTPPFPAYPSGHATFGGVLFQMLRDVYRTDNISFVFVSDEFNGVTRDNAGTVRPFIPRAFGSLSTAEEENGQSRIYLGIHWAFDKTAGIAEGRQIADYIYQHAFAPVHRP